MRIEIPHEHGPSRVALEVDPAHPPAVIRLDMASDASDERRAITLDWSRALDDAGRLRHCPVCGCDAMFVRRTFPRLAIFIAVIGAAVGAAVGYGLGFRILGLAVLAVALLADVVFGALAERMLVCYRCRARFRGVPFRKTHRRWDPVVARRHERPAGASAPAAATSAAPASAAPVTSASVTPPTDRTAAS